MAIIRAVKNLAADLADIICPQICLGCGRRIQTATESLICNECLWSYPRLDHCKNDNNPVTDFFYHQSEKIEYGCCFFEFQKGDVTQNLVHNIKYYGHPELAVRLGKMAAYEIKKYGRFAGVDYIMPVPMHPDKQKKRGFNQAERIGQGMSQILGIPVKEGILAKIINSTTQTRMDKNQRADNSEKIFGYDGGIAEDDTSHYLLVDDVFTTGSTLLACTRKLREARPKCKISIFALGKA